MGPYLEGDDMSLICEAVGGESQMAFVFSKLTEIFNMKIVNSIEFFFCRNSVNDLSAVGVIHFLWLNIKV